MSQISKNVKLLYCYGDKLTVATLQHFAQELDRADMGDELEVSIDPNGSAFTIEGFIEEV